MNSFQHRLTHFAAFDSRPPKNDYLCGILLPKNVTTKYYIKKKVSKETVTQADTGWTRTKNDIIKWHTIARQLLNNWI